VPATPSDAQPAGPEAPRASGWLPWATLLCRVFAIEVLVCPRCAGPRRIVGAVTEPHAVRRLLAALGLAAEPPPLRHGLLTRRRSRRLAVSRRLPPRLPAEPRRRVPTPLSPTGRRPCPAGRRRATLRACWRLASWADGGPGEGSRKQQETCFRAPTLSLRFRAVPGAPPLRLVRAGLYDAEAARALGLSTAAAFVSDEVRLAEAGSVLAR
jgi:hypothetical protein